MCVRDICTWPCVHACACRSPGERLAAFLASIMRPCVRQCASVCALQFWGQWGKLQSHLQPGRKTGTLPPAISLSGSNLPVSECLSLSLCTLLHLLYLLLPRTGLWGPLSVSLQAISALWTSVNNWHSQHLCCGPKGGSPLKTVQP